jgi:hypothetical protein
MLAPRQFQKQVHCGISKKAHYLAVCPGAPGQCALAHGAERLLSLRILSVRHLTILTACGRCPRPPDAHAVPDYSTATILTVRWPSASARHFETHHRLTRPALPGYSALNLAGPLNRASGLNPEERALGSV